MIKIEDVHVVGLEPAIRGMRNPLNSWSKSDSVFDIEDVSPYKTGAWSGYDITGKSQPLRPEEYEKHHEMINAIIGPNDIDLMKRLAKNGPVHAKYRRMIVVYADITAPLYWWKEADTLKVGTVANSCSTMHKIHSRDLTLEDFSYEHLDEESMMILLAVIKQINKERKIYIETKDKKAWYNMIQLLPTSYNQKRTWMLNYEVLTNIYATRKGHKLDEWASVIEWIKTLPYSELITGEEE